MKTGKANDPEDMRQDQLVVQLFDLCDRLFKKVNLDLCLTPYKVVPLSRNDGLMEFLDGAVTVTECMNKYNTKKSIQNFLRDENPGHPHEKYGIDPVVLDTFIRSSAGYCVMTYILAIGDRHLENLMVKPTGHLLHIDFGFIFGQNPPDKKLFGTPMRLTTEMVEAMGGQGSEDYTKFISHCCQAYRILRKNATLLCNMLELMGEAGIQDLSLAQNPLNVIQKVRERLCMDKVDENEAEKWLLSKLNESAGGGKMLDRLHNISIFMQGGL